MGGAPKSNGILRLPRFMMWVLVRFGSEKEESQ
jgi:hypothetical protein